MARFEKSGVRILAQDCFVQTFCGRQESTNGRVAAGEEVKIFTGQFSVRVKPMRQHEDEITVEYGYLPSGKEATAREVAEAQARLDAGNYGPVFAKQ